MLETALLSFLIGTQLAPPQATAYRTERQPVADGAELITVFGRSLPPEPGALGQEIPLVRGLRQDADGAIRFERAGCAAGFPLQIWEDPGFAIPAAQRAESLEAWHSELDWLHAVHGTEYSDGILALTEQFSRADAPGFGARNGSLMEEFSRTKRRLAEPDFLTFSNDHWNFNVRGFNPGGNHGSPRRVSTRSVLLVAGGAGTGISQAAVIQEPYDSLSFVPAVLQLMGKNEDARQLPGRPIKELLTAAARSTATR